MKKLKPVAHRLLVKPDAIIEEQELAKSHAKLKELNFVIEKPDNQKKRDLQGTESGTIIAIGPMAWKHSDYGYPSADWAPWCKVGDKVVFARYVGKLWPHPDTKEEFLIMNDEDIQLVQEDE